MASAGGGAGGDQRTVAAVAFVGQSVSINCVQEFGRHTLLDACNSLSHVRSPSHVVLHRPALSQNQPLYFKTFVGSSEEYLKLQLAAYSALDVVEEKVNDRKGAAARAASEAASGLGAPSASTAAAAASAKDPFLGMLMPVDEYKV